MMIHNEDRMALLFTSSEAIKVTFPLTVKNFSKVYIMIYNGKKQAITSSKKPHIQNRKLGYIPKRDKEVWAVSVKRRFVFANFQAGNYGTSSGDD